MNFAKPNTKISYKQMKRMTKKELSQEIFTRNPLEPKFIGGIPCDMYYTKSVLMDILNFTIDPPFNF